jgi:hypothetical protein
MGNSDDPKRLVEEREAQKPSAPATGSSASAGNTTVQVPTAVSPEPPKKQSARVCPEREREIEEAHHRHHYELERRDRREEFERQLARDDRECLRRLEEEDRKLRENQRKAEEIVEKTRIPSAHDLARAFGILGCAAVKQLKIIGMPNVRIWSEVPWEYAVKLDRVIHGREEPSRAVTHLYAKLPKD